MGRVFRAQDTKLNEEVALKLIKPEIAAERRVVERFRNEIKIARKITHKNVCRMHDLHEEGRTLFLTMEYVRGEDLKSVIHRMKVLSVETAVSIARQVAEGLGEAHKLGITHRDLKPGNVMIDKDGNAKIIDFGIAKSLAGAGTTAEGAVIGTPEYMSPEQVEGKPADVRADIYALGVILFEMVTGRPPFEGETAFSIANKHKSEPPPDPRTLNPQIPVDLSRLILRCMEKPFERRYQTAGELLSDLEAVEAALPTTERSIGRTPSRTRPKASRDITVKFTMKRWLAPATAFVVLAGAFLLWRFLLHPKPAPGPTVSGMPTLAVLDFENISKEESLDFWRSGLPELMITGLSQSQSINVLSGDRVFGILKNLGLADVKRYTREDLIKIAREGGISHVVTGSYIKAGGKLILTLTVQDPRTGQRSGRREVQCQNEEEIPSKVNELTLRVKQDLNLGREQMAMDTDIYKKIEDATTNSPEALKFYLEGRRYHGNGEYRKSIECMENAIAKDPNFAMAYRAIAPSYLNLGYANEGRMALDKALELSDRVSLREKLLIQGYALRDFKQKIEAYQKVLELYPFDAVANNQLGMIYRNIQQEYDKALERFEANTRYHNVAPTILEELMLGYMANSLYDKAQDACEKYYDSLSTSGEWMIIPSIYLQQGYYERALSEAEKIERFMPRDHYLMGDIFYLKGDFEAAEKEYRNLLDSKEMPDHYMGRINLGYLYLAQGKFKKSKEEVRQAIDLGQKYKSNAWISEAYSNLIEIGLASGKTREALDDLEEGYRQIWGKAFIQVYHHLKARLMAEMKNFDEAHKSAQKNKEWTDAYIRNTGNQKFVAWNYYTQAKIAFEQDKIPESISALEESVSLLGAQWARQSEINSFLHPHAAFMGLLAMAYRRAGDLGKAREVFEKITALTSGRQRYGDIYAKSFFMLGEIAEQQGDKAGAAARYREFLDLWKNADLGLPEVEEARKKLAGLRCN
jgi:serine/threonine protein kinase/tetratricopeptide (TPR) repeat protein